MLRKKFVKKSLQERQHYMYKNHNSLIKLLVTINTMYHRQWYYDWLMIPTDYHTNSSTLIDTQVATQFHTLQMDIKISQHYLNTMNFYLMKGNLVCYIKENLNKLTRNWFITINGSVVLIKLILIVSTKVLLFWSVENSILTL